jgi:hypothetical protein
MNGTPGRTDNERINYLEDSEQRLRTNGHTENQVSDHDMLIRLDEKVDGVVEMLKNRPNCPREQCNEHENGIGQLQTTAKWQWVAIGACYVYASTILAMLWRDRKSVV